MGGRFITLEGGEGVGKSTLLKNLKEHFADQSETVRFTREPGGSPRAEKLRNLLLETDDAGGEMTPVTEALLICTARSDHIANTIRPALNAGCIVICDRFSDSTLAYQGGKLPMSELRVLTRFASEELEPDLTLLLDADPESLLSRRQERDISDRFENRDMNFHTGVRTRFLELARAEPQRIRVLDALLPPEEILKRAVSLIMGFRPGDEGMKDV